MQKNLKVLIADDDLAARESLETLLARKYPALLLFSAGDGKAALEHFRQHQPDIVISDIIMPEVDGFKVAREIRSVNAMTKLIILTGLSDLSDFHSAVADIPIDHTIMKPVDLKKLFAAIDQCVAEINLYQQNSCR